MKKMKTGEEWAETENKRLGKIVTAVAGVVLAVKAVIVVVDGLAVAGDEVGADESVQVDAGPAAELALAEPAPAVLAVVLAVAAVAVAVAVGKVAKIVVDDVAAAAAAVEG